MITNTAARDSIIERHVAAARKPANRNGARVKTSWTKTRFLARGEIAFWIAGSAAFAIVYSPAGSRDETTTDMLLFFGPNAVLSHEEPASNEMMRRVGFAS